MVQDVTNDSQSYTMTSELTNEISLLKVWFDRCIYAYALQCYELLLEQEHPKLLLGSLVQVREQHQTWHLIPLGLVWASTSQVYISLCLHVTRC